MHAATRSFQKAVERPDVPWVTPHDVGQPASFAGVDVKALQHMLGHASAAMTLDTYPD